MNGQQRTARWLNWAGDTFTSDEVCEFLGRSQGSSYTVDELERTFPVGSVHSNGGIWFQRVNDETEVSNECNG